MPGDLLIARNPDPDSSLPYLLRLPIDGGVLFRTKGKWPRTNALFCYPVPLDEWPTAPDLVESIPLRACQRRGAAIDVVADRGREQRSQIVFTRARGREMVFWQSPRTRKQSRPQVRVPTARAAGVTGLTILIDTRERYPYRFSGQQVDVERRALRCGDYAIELGVDPTGGALLAAVERKSLDDLVTSLTSGRLSYALGELSTLPRAAVVVEDRYSAVLKLPGGRAATVADGLAELAVRWPAVPVQFCETRKLAEEWTYRYLTAAHVWTGADKGSNDPPAAAADRPTGGDVTPGPAPTGATGVTAGPTPAALRAWARAHGLVVSERGRIPNRVLEAWRMDHAGGPTDG